MTDPLIDDVKTLLDKGKGDERILKQICRACENNEVISNYERNYVKNLSEKHLGRLFDDEDSHNDIKSTKILTSNMPQKQDPVATTTSARVINSSSKKPKLIFGCGVIIAVLVITAVYYGVFNTDPDDSIVIPKTPSPNSFSIKTDLSTYQKGDIISISGKSNISGKIKISIENQNGKLIWSEQVSVKSSGQFSTLVIAGGPGWDNSGIYTITADNNSEIKSTTFSFKG